jgi:hypothetical protein
MTIIADNSVDYQAIRKLRDATRRTIDKHITDKASSTSKKALDKVRVRGCQVPLRCYLLSSIPKSEVSTRSYSTGQEQQRACIEVLHSMLVPDP